MAINRTSPKKGKVVDIPDATITIGTPTAGAGQVSVAFTVATTPATGGPVQGYTAISNPGNITANASASPVVVTGLTNDTAYTFQVAARNATGRGPLSSASASATPVDPSGFVSIATTTVGAGGTSTITFSSIPQVYKHLQIRGIGRMNSGGDVSNSYVTTRFNSDSGSNYAWHQLDGNGSSATAGGGASATSANTIIVLGSGTLANCYSPVVCDILDYSSTNKYKTVRALTGAEQNYTNSSGDIYFNSALWMNTNAITQIDLTIPTKNFAQYSQYALYGIKG